MNPNTDSIKQILSSDGAIGIVVSSQPNLDQMGAALGLYLSLKDSGKNVSVVSSQDPLVEVSNLVGIDKVKKTFEGGGEGDLTVSFPYKEGEIEKISYTLENGFLNIIVKPSELGLTFEQKDVLFKRSGGGAPKILFTMGIQRLSDLTSIFNMDNLKDTNIINIDNNTENQNFGEIQVVDTNASSVSELVSDIMVELGLRFDLDISQNLLSGITFATQNFSNPRSSALAFEMASMMMRNGAKRGKSKEKQSQGVNGQNQNSNFVQTPAQTLKNLQNFQNLRNRGNIQRENEKENDDTTPPGDWLEPKVFKGSTNVG